MIFILTLLLSFSLHANDIYVIVDSSGSMAALDDNSIPRIETAKKTLKSLVGKIPPATKLSIISYGNTKAKDCSDINIIYPLSTVDVNKSIAQIDSLIPLGQTPIEKTLQLTIDSVPVSSNASIILITDGIESCGGDPCKLIKALKAKQNIQFKVDVIGFNIQSDTQSLKCIADESGGQFFDAKNSQELLDIADDVIKNETQPSGFLELKFPNNEKRNVSFIVFDSQNKPIAQGQLYSTPIKLPLGKYRLEVQDKMTSEKLTNNDIEVQEGSTTQVELSGFGQIHEVNIEFDDSMYRRVYLQNKENKQFYYLAHNEQKVAVPAGEYLLGATSKAFGVDDYISENFNKIDQSMSLVIKNPITGTLIITSSSQESGLVQILKNEKASQFRLKDYTYEIKLSPGEYKVRYRNDTDDSKNISIDANSTKKITLD